MVALHAHPSAAALQGIVYYDGEPVLALLAIPLLLSVAESRGYPRLTME